MLIQVRCYTCGKVIGHLCEEYETRFKAGEKPSAILDSLHLHRFCCRRMLITFVDVLTETMQFETAKAQYPQKH